MDHLESLPEPFEEFYRKFTRVKDIVRTPEWEAYSKFYEFDKYELEIDWNENPEKFSAERQYQEIEKCVKSFPYFCHRYVKIMHPAFGMVPFIPYKYQRKVIKDYQKYRFNIISKFRQGGLTTVTVIWGAWRCMYKKDQQLLVASKTDREAMSAGEIVDRMLEHLPLWMYDKKVEPPTKHEKLFKETSSRLQFYTPEAARGKSMTFLIIDEAAFVADMETHWKSLYPTIATGGKCIVVSTVNGVGNWYEETYHKAESGQGPFHVIDLDYWEHPQYSDKKWVNDTKAMLGEQGWKQEILRSFIGSGSTFFPSDLIVQLSREVSEIIPARILMKEWRNATAQKHEWDIGALWIWKEPIEGHEYVIGADCAEGTGGPADNSCYQIIDINKMEQVAEFYSNTIPSREFAINLRSMGLYYNTALVIVEQSSYGAAVLSYLEHDLQYESIFYDENKSKKVAPGVKTSSANRPVFLEALQSRLLNKSLLIRSYRFTEELRSFLFNARTKKAQAQKGKHDDAIMAMAMSMYAINTNYRNLPVGANISHEVLKPQITPDLMAEIHAAIREGLPEVVEEPVFDPKLDSYDENLPPEFQFRRKYDKLLREFNW